MTTHNKMAIENQTIIGDKQQFADKIINYNYPQPETITLEVDLYHLPKPTTALIGRKTELTQLTQRLTDGKTRLAIIVAAGGIGKSALTDEWLQQIAQANYYGKTRVFGWSFYSQGSHNTFTNSQPFFSTVLPFLGISEIPKDEIEKARLLARELQKQACLLILDGLEPLQYAENLQSMNGELQDSALKELIACFRRMPGQSFILFSSRQPLVELDNWQSSSYLNIDLERLTEDEGGLLLRQRKISLSDDELKEISHKLRGHALSLVLFGCLLSQHRKIQESWRKVLKLDEKEDDNNEFHTFDVLECYCKELNEHERTFFQLLGLFDRPMNAAEKAVLIANANHAKPLRALTAKQWQAVEQRLEKSGVLLGKKGTFERLEWDTHPIIRSFFSEKFKENHPEAFKQAHLVLFDYYQRLPKKELSETLEETLPLYSAVVHGCLAEEYQKAFGIYWKRICQNGAGNGNSVYYNLYKFGEYSQDLTALLAFFPSGWEFLENGLIKNNQTELLSMASFCLMSLGRLEETITPRKVGMKIEKEEKDWKNAAISARNLVDSYLPLAQLTNAYTMAQEAINCASNSKDTFSQMASFSYLASVLYRIGNFEESFKHFQQAEKLQQQRGKEYLSSFPNFCYCILLLETAKDKTTLREVLLRAESSLELSISLLDIALTNLIFALTHIFLNELTKVEKSFQQAIQNIQKANAASFTPPFYLYRADFYLTQNQLEKAADDLNSAWEIIERCGMKLYAVDYLLIHGRYCLAMNDNETTLNHYQEAKNLIQETGYHLRDAELDLLAAEYCLRSPKYVLDSKNADYYLQKSKNRIEEIGQWGLMPRWESLNQYFQN